ncbi:MAG: VOC family protein [Burkholderiales bacterium]|nr:VOC family protein [Burkholderiales bacterium]
MTFTTDAARAQLPEAGALTLDHVAYFVPHVEAASDALDRLGFTLTPFSAQSHRLEPGGPLVPAGTANRCVMLERGYLEILTPTGDTGVANQLRVAIKRYTGMHSIVFGTVAPDADHARLEHGGFAPLPPVSLQREIATDRDVQTARFTVVRVPPGAMAEGRIQYCRHHTPELLWQERWLAHPNRATALTGVVICVADPASTARRYERFTGLPVQAFGNVWRMDSARGWLLFVDPRTLERALGITAPCVPWIAGQALASSDIESTRAFLSDRGVPAGDLAGGALLLHLSPDVGGMMILERAGTTMAPAAFSPGV